MCISYGFQNFSYPVNLCISLLQGPKKQGLAPLLCLREVGVNPGYSRESPFAMALVAGQVKVRGKASHLQHLECVAAHRHSLAFGEHVGLIQREGVGAGAEGACRRRSVER